MHDNTANRWDNPFTHDLMGASGALRPAPAPKSNEARNAKRIADRILAEERRFVAASASQAVEIARDLIDGFYDRSTKRALISFPHQNWDNHDPGYRMTKVLPTLSDALHDGPASALGVDREQVVAIGDGLDAFCAEHAKEGDVRFLPIARLSAFLRYFLSRFIEVA